jgi:fatty-acyl-CoA synthase
MYYNGEFCSGLARGGLALAGLPAPTTVEEFRISCAAPRDECAAAFACCCPQMHGTGMWLGTLLPMLCGGSVVTISKWDLDPDALFREVETHRVTDLTIVGDAFAKPMLGARYRTRSRHAVRPDVAQTHHFERRDVERKSNKGCSNTTT